MKTDAVFQRSAKDKVMINGLAGKGMSSRANDKLSCPQMYVIMDNFLFSYLKFQCGLKISLENNKQGCCYKE